MSTAFNPVRWLKIAFLGCVLGLLLTLAVSSVWLLTGTRPQPSPFKLSGESTKAKLMEVVGSQLTAFRSGDYARAYEHAGAGLKRRMTAAAFENMVRKTYPAIANSKQAGFGMIFDNGDFALVNVSILDQSGGVLRYQYLLRREKSGWKINSVGRTRVTGVAI